MARNLLFFNIVVGVVLFALPCFARLQYTGGYEPGNNLQTYEKEAYQYERSIIYVFTRGEKACYSCPKTVSMIQDFYNKYYQNMYDLYVVDYQDNDQYNYRGAYNLSKPLEVVLARVSNGKSDGYKKIEDLQNRVSNKNGFERELKNQIDSFLGR